MRLPERIGDALERADDEARFHDAWEGTRRRIAARSRRGRGRYVAGGVLAAAAVALISVLTAAPGDGDIATGPLVLSDGRAPIAAEAVADPRALTLSDRSRIELAPGARVVPAANDGARFELALERGRARFDVTPGGPRAWRIECGPVIVRVIGTAFVVERAAEHVRVEVERGRVRVEGEPVPGGARTLGRGESIVVSLAAGSSGGAVSGASVGAAGAVPGASGGAAGAVPGASGGAAGAVPGASGGAAGAVLGSTGAAFAVPRSSGVDDSPRASRGSDPDGPTAERAWQDMAEHGAHDEAYRALGAEDGVLATAETASPRELMLLADVARLSGHPRDAVAPLERMLEAHPTAPEAPLAAITLARLELGPLRRPAAAARAFERALALGVPAAFDAEVRAGLALARSRAGDDEGAAQAARECLDRHVTPPHAAELRALLASAPAE